MSGRNGYIEFEAEGQRYRHVLFIDTVAQQQALTGDIKQSRMSRQFYPRSHMPGDISVTGRCESQQEYQELALFIRKHQRAMISTPSSVIFHRLDTTNAGYRRLMKLYVYGEGILMRGLIERFTLTKHGVFEPAPQFSFDFKVIYDPHANNITLSRALVHFTEGGSDSYSKSTVPVEAITSADTAVSIEGAIAAPTPSIPNIIPNPAAPVINPDLTGPTE